jgi:hypothetical protein
MPTLELSRETENAIKAGRFADLLNRNLCKKKYARIQQKMLSEATESVLHYYHEGPSGDPEQDTETLNLVLLNTHGGGLQQSMNTTHVCRSSVIQMTSSVG